MATITDLVDALSEALGVERGSVAVAARKLQLAGAMPTGDRGRHGGVAMTAEHAATLLLGFLAAPRVGLAPVAARLFGDLPAVSAVFQRANAGRIVRTGHRIEDVPIGLGEGPRRTILTHSLHGALTDIIDNAAHGMPSACAPTELGFNRDLAAPVAWMRFPIVAPGQDPCEGEIFYAPSDGLDPCERFRGSDLRITASTHGAVLARLGKVLWEDAKVAIFADLKKVETEAASDEERAHVATL